MKILITGENSFIGLNFRSYSQYSNIRELSLINNNNEELNFTGFDVILHLAAIVHQTGKKTEADYFKINRDLTVEIAKKARNQGVRQFIFMSTIKVYGSLIDNSEPATENSPCKPDSYYGRSKFEAENELKKLETNNFTISIIRTPLVYGIGVKANMLRLVKLIKYLPVLPFAGIRNKRNFTFAENLVRYIDRIIEKREPGTFIAMDVESVSTSELVSVIARGLGRKILLFRLPDFIVGILRRIAPQYYDQLFGSLILDNSRTRHVLDFNPPFSTQEGLRKMIKDFNNQ